MPGFLREIHTPVMLWQHVRSYLCLILLFSFLRQKSRSGKQELRRITGERLKMLRGRAAETAVRALTRDFTMRTAKRAHGTAQTSLILIREEQSTGALYAGGQSLMTTALFSDFVQNAREILSTVRIICIHIYMLSTGRRKIIENIT